MKKALLVARWEFITTVTRRAYIFAVIAMPVFYGVMFGAAGLAGRSASASANRVPTAIVDKAGLVDFSMAAALAAKRDRRPLDGVDVGGMMSRRGDTMATAAALAAPRSASLVEYDDVDKALADLQAQKVATVFVINADYFRTGSISMFTRDNNIFSLQADRQRQTQLADAIRVSLMQQSMAADAIARAYAPVAAVARFRVAKDGSLVSLTDDSGLGPFAGSLGVFMLLTMAIFFSAGFLQQATNADRQNRMIEILLSSVDPTELLIGKILGLGAAGLLQVAIYVSLIIVPGATLLSIFQVPLAKLAISLVYFGLGYMLFASLMAGTGMIGRTAQESAQLSALWTLTAASPMFFIANIGTAPNGWLARTLSFFPPTSAITMMLRLGTADVPLVDVLGSITIDVVAIYLILRAAAKLFRTAALMYGKRPTLPELIRWLRVA